MRKRLLIVEDEPAALVALTEFFGSCGLDVDSAARLEDACVLLDVSEPDLVLTDLRLGPGPEPLGLELARRVRERHASTPIILLTAHCTPQIESQARSAGVDVVLQKPVRLPELYREVCNQLGRRQVGVQ